MVVFKSEKLDIIFSNNENSLFIKAHTERLVVKSYQDIDFENAVSLYGNPELTKFFDHGEPRTLVEIQNYLSCRGTYYFKHGRPFGIFALFLKGKHDCIGHIDIVPTEQRGEVEIGWIMHKEYQGKGYCSEAVLQFLMPFIDILKNRNIMVNGGPVNKVMATAHPENLSSNKVITKAGLKLYKQENRYKENPRNWYRLKLEIS
ncbi:MAG: hypothetical protein S4CHLAM7_07920 [Chlamydiae bacterium]|nr:hypothetical protein [Chlamydiota bacterium]